MSHEEPSIYDYSDFRAYLKEFQEAKRKTNFRFTKAHVCRLLGIPNSRSYFSDVLNGKRISETYIERFIRALGLNRDEGNYFRALVHYSQSNTPDQREIYLEQLISMNRSPFSVLDQDKFEYYRDWYNLVIRALLVVIDFKDDYHALAQMVYPRIKAAQAQKSIKTLKRLGLIQSDENGYLKPTTKSLSSGRFADSAVVRQYQSDCLALAQRVLANQPDAPMEIWTNTVSISDEAREQIMKRMEKFKSEVRTIIHKDPGKARSVYQINMQFFPNTETDQ